MQRTQNIQSNLEKKVGGVGNLEDFKTYRATIIKTVWGIGPGIDRPVELNRGSQLHRQLIFDKGTKAIQWNYWRKKTLFDKMVLEKLDILIEKNKGP